MMGATWADAQLPGRVRFPHAWRHWEAGPGEPPISLGECQRLMARAEDDQGRIQPMEHDRNHRTVMIHHVVPVEVEVGFDSS